MTNAPLPIIQVKQGNISGPWWRNATPYLFIAPFYVIFLLFRFLPIVFSLGISLFDWRGVRTGAFIGFENYLNLFQDPAFHKALLNTAVIWVGTVPVGILLATVLAVLLNSKTTVFKNLFRTAYFLPVVTSLVITGMLFGQLFSQTYGWVNSLLALLRISPINWLADPPFMKPVVILALLWRYTGNDMIIMLAGLQSIPEEVNEAAQVDGANGLQVFYRITLPLLRPVILFDAIVSTIGTFNLFAEPYQLFQGSGGGVGQAGLVTGTFLYENSFVLSKFGYGAAIAWTLAILVFVLSLLQLRLNRSDLME